MFFDLCRIANQIPALVEVKSDQDVANMLASGLTRYYVCNPKITPIHDNVHVILSPIGCLDNDHIISEPPIVATFAGVTESRIEVNSVKDFYERIESLFGPKISSLAKANLLYESYISAKSKEKTAISTLMFEADVLLELPLEDDELAFVNYLLEGDETYNVDVQTIEKICSRISDSSNSDTIRDVLSSIATVFKG